MYHEHGARGFSFQLEEAPSEAPELGRLDLDWSDLAAPGPAEEHAVEQKARKTTDDPGRSPSRSSHRLQSGARPAKDEPPGSTPLMPHAAAASRSEPAPRPLLSAFAEAPPEAPAQSTSRSESPASPAVRRLRFPAAVAPRKASPRPSTRFADSIGRSRPTADTSGEVRLDVSSPPEDLPLRAEPRTERLDDRPETTQPETAALLRQASAIWSSAKDTATDLGGRGLESGRLLATQMSEALRERLERKVAVAPAAPAPEPASEAWPEAAPQPNHSAALPVRGRSRGLSSLLPKQGTGPILALVAALGMFIASRQLLGVGGVGLSASSPQIPDLGQVDHPAASSRTASATAQTAEGPGKPAGPPPAMVTEVVPLPPGMAWPGKGLLEVVTSEDELVYVDGVFTGRGPLRRVPVAPGAHEVSIRKEGSERHGTADVEPGRTTRALFRGK